MPLTAGFTKLEGSAVNYLGAAKGPKLGLDVTSILRINVGWGVGAHVGVLATSV
jgi:hypothetical protein